MLCKQAYSVDVHFENNKKQISVGGGWGSGARQDEKNHAVAKKEFCAKRLRKILCV